MKNNKSNLECYISLNEVYKIYPNFIPKLIFQMLNKNGKLTKEKYVECNEVKSLGDKAKWHKHFSQIGVYHDWYHLNDNTAIRLILINEK